MSPPPRGILRIFGVPRWTERQRGLAGAAAQASCALFVPHAIIGRAMTGAAARSPVILIVDPDPQASKALESALARRFGQDYRIVTAGSADAALETLARLADDHEDVALVAAELHLDGVDGVEFLERAHVAASACHARPAPGHGRARHAHTIRRAACCPESDGTRPY